MILLKLTPAKLAFLKLVILFSIIIFNSISCRKSPHEVTTAVYHWKSSFNPTEFELNYLKNINNEKIYVRIFDVDWDEIKGFPTILAPLSNSSNLPNFVPVIFITNKTFLQINGNQLDTLVNLISTKIKHFTEGSISYSEIQFDCDWNTSTQSKYFTFLEKIKNGFKDKKISATIRLHQIKFAQKTGIPPVDKGLLMAYNMGDLDDSKTENSILDLEILKSYLVNFDKYALPLDVALPLFSWGVVLRDGEAVKLITNLDATDWADSRAFISKKSENKYVLLKNMYLKGYYLFKDDEIRLENVPLSILQKTADLLAQKIDNQQLTVSFYHLDSLTFTHYRYEDLQDIVRRFR